MDFGGVLMCLTVGMLPLWLLVIVAFRCGC